MLAYTIAKEWPSNSHWLRSEPDVQASRRNITLLAGSGAARQLQNGTVMGKQSLGAATAAAAAGNTGNGTIGTVTVGAGAMVGVYQLVCVATATNAGEFIVEAPDGAVIGTAVVAVAFNTGGLSFTIVDGATDFANGDRFTITVAAGAGKYVPLDLAGTNGTAVAAGVLYYDYTVPDGQDLAGVVLDGPLVLVTKDNLIYPAGATTGQKAAAWAQLEALGFRNRERVLVE